MHRLPFIAVFALLAASVPLSAQRGGGHASAGGHGFGGGHSSFAGGHGGFAGRASGHTFAGTHSASGFAPRSFPRGSAFGGPISSLGFSRGRSGIGLRIRSRGFRNNCFGYGCGWGWGYGYPYLGGGIDPYWWWDSDSSSDPGPYPNQPYYDDGSANGNDMEGQVVPMRPGSGYYPRSATPPQHREESAQAVAATVLVFRDQRKQEVQNYAIVGQTLWVFAPERTQKIPLAELDINATQKTNDERGVDFRLPGASEGQ